MKLSKISQEIEASFTRKLFNEAAKYDDVIDFTLGDPDFITPEYIRMGGCNAINEGKTHYSANNGLKELREAISNEIEAEQGIKYDPETEIIVTIGAMQALYLSMLCLLDEGDEVIIPAPFWVNYKHMVKMCHGTPVIIQTKAEDNFTVKLEDVKNAITKKTRAIIINSPNNPSGIVYDYDTVKELCRISAEKNILIFWDECYKNIVYDGARVTSVLEFPHMKENAVIVNSFSKKFSMTGWRIGYLAGDAELVKTMTKLQENMVACAPLPSQYAAINALKTDSKITDEMVAVFKKRRDILVNEISGIKGLKCNIPQGTFYLLVDIGSTGMSSVDFAYELLRKKHIAVVPGITYGECCEGYVRLAYTISEEKIIAGMARLKEFIEELEI